MTSEPNPSPGSTLWQGDQKLELTKAPDRFTARVRPGVRPEALAAAHALVHAGRATRQDLEVFAVSMDARDTAMDEVRSSPDVEFASHVYQVAGDPTSRLYLTDEITVQFETGLSDTAIETLTEALGLVLLKEVPGLPRTYVYRVTDRAAENPLKLANRLRAEPGVIAAEPNVVVPTQSFFTPDDPLYPSQWHLEHHGGQGLEPGSHVDAARAWEITRGDREVVVAIADLALCDQSHVDLQGPAKVVAPHDLDPVPDDRSDHHGTACAAVAVAEANGHGVVGVAPGCALMPIRINSELDDSSIEALFDWAVSNGASVISCSWGPALRNFPLSLRKRLALERAASLGRNGLGCVILFAAGNANRPLNGTVDEQGWLDGVTGGPTVWHNGFAAHPDVIAVAACTSRSQKAAYSSWGPEISLCAPSNNVHPQFAGRLTFPQIFGPLVGLGIVTACSSGTSRCGQSGYTRSFGGTSSACPTVAGAAALVLSANPGLTAREVREILESTADKIEDDRRDPQLGTSFGGYDAGGHSQWFGHGKVNAFRAVNEAVRRKAAAGPTTVVRQSLTPSLMIPGNDEAGVHDVAHFSEEARLVDLAIEVDIAHSSIGDLRLTLTSPSGARVLLHDRSGGMSQNLRRRFDPSTTPGLSTLTGQQLQGSWVLQVQDLAPGGDGLWNSWSIIAAVQLANQPAEASLTLVDTPGLLIPDNDPGGISCAMQCDVTSTIRDIAVSLDITHSYIGDLGVALVSPSGTRVTLHGREGGSANNLVTTYTAATALGLQRLRGETTGGLWRLTVSDMEAEDLGKLNRWTLKLTYTPVAGGLHPAADLAAPERTVRPAADLKLINGVGPAVESRLHQAGILTFRQLASLTPEAIVAHLSGLNGISPSRIRNLNWIAEAERLAAEEQAKDEHTRQGWPGRTPAPLEELQSLHYETFTLRVTKDARGTPVQTYVAHVQGSDEKRWAGWHRDLVIDYVVSRGGLEDGSAKGTWADSPGSSGDEPGHPPLATPPDADKPDSAPASAWYALVQEPDEGTESGPEVTLANTAVEPEPGPEVTLAITRVSMSVVGAESGDQLSRAPRLCGEVEFRLSGQLDSLLAYRHAPYRLQFFAQELLTGALLALTEAQQLLVPADQPTPDPECPHSFVILCTTTLNFDPPGPGRYRLRSKVVLPENDISAIAEGNVFKVQR